MLQMTHEAEDQPKPRRYGKEKLVAMPESKAPAGVPRKDGKKGTHMPTIIPEINDRIRQIRIDLGVTQKDFAAMINITLSSLKAIENKVVAPNLFTLRQVHHRCGKSYDYIMEGRGS